MKKNETSSYNGWLISDNLFKRAFAVVGYFAIGVGIILFIYNALEMLFGYLS